MSFRGGTAPNQERKRKKADVGSYLNNINSDSHGHSKNYYKAQGIYNIVNKQKPIRT